MYKQKNKTPLTPHDTQFWRYAAKLKRDGHKTIVHALAWEFPTTYSYLITLLQSKTPLERISILLWKNHLEAMRRLEKQGYGTFSPSSLRTFREKYFKIGDLPNPELIRAKQLAEAQLLMLQSSQLQPTLDELLAIEMRVHPTRIGHKLRKQNFQILQKIAKFQSRLS